MAVHLGFPLDNTNLDCYGVFTFSCQMATYGSSRRGFHSQWLKLMLGKIVPDESEIGNKFWLVTFWLISQILQKFCDINGNSVIKKRIFLSPKICQNVKTLLSLNFCLKSAQCENQEIFPPGPYRTSDHFQFQFSMMYYVASISGYKTFFYSQFSKIQYF